MVAPAAVRRRTPLPQQLVRPALLLQLERHPADQLPVRVQDPARGPAVLPRRLAPRQRSSSARRSSKVQLLPDLGSAALLLGRPNQLPLVRMARARPPPLLLQRLSLPRLEAILHRPAPSRRSRARQERNSPPCRRTMTINEPVISSR